MAEPFADPAVIAGYHAHVYYDPARTREVAAHVREGVGDAFPAATLGSWHDEAVGPHTVAMYQVAFAVEDFARLVPWLMLNHAGLSILVHPNTDDGFRDHAENALWIGAQQQLRFDVLRDLLGQ